jgi:alanine-glyoxylate transaminase/serine-glyoxylate transaminase/serine-pyruvate transaminase
VTNPFLKKQMYSSFIPPKRILMGPGPPDVPQRVLDASARQTIGHLDPFFLTLMDEIKVMLQQAYKTDNALTMPVSAPGSSGMETCFVNLVEPGEIVLVCINGVFGGRMKENVERCGGTAIVVEDDWGTPVSLEKVEQALNEHPQIRLVAFVHAETSTGASSDAQQITRLAHQHDAMVIVDAVTSLAGSPLEVDAWDIDAIYSGSQKCLSCLPGLSPVSFNVRAVEKIRNRKSKVQSWFMDLNLVMGYWGSDGARSYHHTAPVNSLYALHESLLMLHEEGLENSWARHQKNHQLLKIGLAEMGIEFLVDEAYRLPQLNTVYIPEGVDDAALRRNLLENYQLEIGAGIGALAGKVWRIGLMGYASREENVELCLRALKETI